MELKSTFTTLILVILTFGCSSSDRDILTMTNSKLQKISTVLYQSKIEEFDSYSVELLSSDSSSVFFDFNSNDSIIGAKYLFSGSKRDIGFDGSIEFNTIKEKQQLIYKSVNSYDDLSYEILNYSILQFRNLLPQMLSDTSFVINRQSDTIINKTQCYQYSISLYNQVIGINGKLVESHNSLNTRDDNGYFHYKLIIDKKENLPKQFIVYSYKKTPYRIVSFSNYNFSPLIDDSELDYTKRDPNFTKDALFDLVKAQRNNDPMINTTAKDWSLPSMDGNTIQLSKLNSRLILLEFWFPGCVGCAAAIPDLNAIQKKYKSKGLQVFGVEYTKEDSTGLSAYISKMKIEFPTLYTASEMARDYKVSVAPTYFLINNQKKVVYKKVGFNREDLIDAIEENLK
jgi:peroxiredoxin